MAKKISDFIKSSDIGKSLDAKTLSVIDKVFENAVVKGVKLKLAEAVKAQNSKFKTEMTEMLDGYIDKVIKERLMANAVDQAKVKIAEQIVSSFQNSFGEIFMTEGNNKLAQILKDKVVEIETLKENFEKNLEVIKESFNKKLVEANQKSKAASVKMKIASEKAEIAKNAKTINEDKNLSELGKVKANAIMESKVKRGESFDIMKIIESVKKVNGVVDDGKAIRKPASTKFNEHYGKKREDSSEMDQYMKQLND